MIINGRAVSCVSFFYIYILKITDIFSYLFWSNIGSSTKIERSTLSGANRQSIIYQGLGMPLGIAVDQSEPRIYWVDYIRDTIESADFDGRNRNILRRISHSMFYDIALYKVCILLLSKNQLCL